VALTRRRKVVFALLAIVLSAGAVLVALLGADLVVHQRAEHAAGLNRDGYRGPVVGRKQAGELRVAMVGGSTVFGYGVGWNESIASYLEHDLQERLHRTVHVINLGFNNEGAHAFVANLDDFKYLDYDVIVLYEGYNDLAGDGAENRSVYRRASAIYRLTGYYPILPLYLDEKAKMLRYGNDLNAAYANDGTVPTTFRPNLAQRTSAGALQAIADVSRALDTQLSTVPTTPTPATPSESSLGCSHPYVFYCESVAAAVRFGLANGKGVVVGSQPRLPAGRPRELHTLQQAMLAKMLAQNFGSDKRVVWADMSSLVDLQSIDVTFDAMHLKPAANATVAAAFVDPVIAAKDAAGIQ
jgi:hypothetical protein